jgi:putative transposase
MERQPKDTMIVTNKSLVGHEFDSVLDGLLIKCRTAVKKMLANRHLNSSKFYPEIPCVVSKSLITKYQKNLKCKKVHTPVIPVCGDKGKQIKLESNNQLRIPAITRKQSIKIHPLKPIVGFARSVEFFKRDSRWFLSYTYNTPVNAVTCQGFVGIDRNAVGNVATLADPSTGHVERLGPDIKQWKDNLKSRKAKLQSKKAFGALQKLKRKQSNRTKDINHKVSKQIVNYAVTHRKSIVLEDLGKIRDSKKCGKYVQKSNWSYFQLEQYVKYKASLRGVSVVYVDPRNTSKGCSRCGNVNNVNGKKFKCKQCGHIDHRDANAAFNIALRGQTDNERELSARLIDDPQTSKGVV